MSVSVLQLILLTQHTPVTVDTLLMVTRCACVKLMESGREVNHLVCMMVSEEKQNNKTKTG